jgi:hypothetical protein
MVDASMQIQALTTPFLAIMGFIVSLINKNFLRNYLFKKIFKTKKQKKKSFL